MQQQDQTDTSTPMAEASSTSTPTPTPTNQTQSSATSVDEIAAPAKGPVRTPFAHPLESCKPIQRPSLTPEQTAKYEALLATVQGWTTIPASNAKNAPQEPIQDEEKMWLTRECLLRYLRAASWNSTEAPKRLLYTLAWRREFKVSSIAADHVSVESETGKQFILGYDINARPCLYMNPGRQNTKKSERQIEHLVFMLEAVITMMDPGQEMTALLISFKNSTSGGSPSVAQGRQVLTILQSHYPERLGRALISDLPWYISTFFKLISPFIDPVTKEKMVFNEDLRKYIPPIQLDKNFGGDADFDYEHDIYWPALNKMCEERRAGWRDRWIKGGMKIGEHEAYLRGGNQKPLASETSAQDQKPLVSDNTTEDQKPMVLETSNEDQKPVVKA